MYNEKIKENFGFFGGLAFLYACLYVICMYRNNSGITYGLFAIGTILFIVMCVKKLELKLKKGSIFYIVSIMLLAISTFCTDDGRLRFFNKTGIFLLTMSFVLEILYNTKKWNLSKYISAIATVLFMSIGEIYRPFADTAKFFGKKENKKGRMFIYAFLGIVVTFPLVWIVWALLASADIVFKQITDRFLEYVDFWGMIQIIFMFSFMFCLSYCIICYAGKRKIKEEVKDNRIIEPLMAIPVVSIMSILYLVFSLVQIIYLFMGNMQLPEGITYAEYAREGFFQLLVVSIINLIIVLLCLSFFKKNIILKIVLGVMSGCTFIMIASSAMRMIIYIQYYYLTFLRVLVLWSLAVLFLLFVGIVVYIFAERFPLFKYSMVVVTCMYLVISFAHPDYLIAKVNIAGSDEATRSEFFKGDAYDDFEYLSKLNADAAPVMLEWMEDEGYKTDYYYYDWRDYIDAYGSLYEGEKYACKYVYRLNERVDDVGIRSFNVSRYYAKSFIESRASR